VSRKKPYLDALREDKSSYYQRYMQIWHSVPRASRAVPKPSVSEMVLERVS
jgi:hypothetical protein